MIGWTLGRYFLLRYLSITAWFFAGITTLAFLIDFTEFSSRTSALPKYSMSGAIWVSMLHLPVMMQQIVPFIALFAGMATLISLNRKYELVVTRAAGVSAWQFLAPPCIGAVLVGIFAITVINPLAAYGYSRSQVIEAQWRNQASTQVIASQVPWLRQRGDEGDTIIGAKAVIGNGRIFSDAVVIQLDKNGELTRRLDAERAVLRQGHWELKNVTETLPGGAPRSIEIEKIKTKLNPEIVAQSLSDPRSVPLFDIPEKIRVSKAFGYPTYPLRMQFHSLMATPALLVAMTLIAAMVSLRFVRFGQSGAMIVGGIAAGFLLYVVSVLVTAFGRAGFVPPVIAAWLPVVVAGFIGVTFLLHREDG